MTAEISDRVREIAAARECSESEVFERADRERSVVEEDVDWGLNA